LISGCFPTRRCHEGDKVGTKVQSKSRKAQFARYLRRSLLSLYDPSVLRGSPLTDLLGVAQRDDVISALRYTLISAIESLRPNENAPSASKSWRVYQILRRRYVEQVMQSQVASELGLSVRQLQRDEKLARGMLVDHLWITHDLENQENSFESMDAQVDNQASLTDAHIPSRTQELEWLKKSVRSQMTDVGEMIRRVLETISSLMKSSGVSVEYAAQEHSPDVPLQVPVLRQALLNILSTTIRHFPGGRISIYSEVLSQELHIDVCATAGPDAPSLPQPDASEDLRMAQELIRLCQGSLEIAAGAGDEHIPGSVERDVFNVKVTLPVVKKVTVLVIDDNADALQLFQRYLSGGRYHFVGTQDSLRGMALAEELSPQIIVVDVMMPERDGWTLLGQLREHPRTRSIPVVVCTILPHEELAFSLGAAAFIRKPVKRVDLLSALDQQLDLPPKESN